MASFRFEFEWDPAKAGTNFTKYGVDFERAAEIFCDPLALTILDGPHSINEVRWITMGKNTRGQFVLVVHTFEQIDGEKNSSHSAHFSQTANEKRDARP